MSVELRGFALAKMILLILNNVKKYINILK